VRGRGTFAKRWLTKLALGGLVAIGAAFAMPACGDDLGPELKPALDRALAAFANRDAHALCRSLSKDGLLMIGSSAHEERPVDCPRDVRKFLAETEAFRAGPRPRVIDTVNDGGDRATAKLQLAGETRVALPFTREGDEWKLDALFGASLSLVQAVNYPGATARLAVDGRPARVDAEDSVAVRAADEAGRPLCPDTALDERGLVVGGCEMELATDQIDLSVWGPFGVLPYGDCDVFLRLLVDGSGRAWVTDLEVDGWNPCPDTVACRGRDMENVPWAATIEPDDAGRALLRIVNVCLDTCIGRFRGDWDMEMTPTIRGWRLRFVSMIGDSGFKADGSLTSRGNSIAIAG